ncbi:MAG: hypothetical protein ACI82G_002672, partial [Bradymonadia bacterium]
KERLQVVRGLLSDVKLAKKETGVDMTDEQELQFLATAAKKRRQSIEAFDKGGRADLADNERAELVIIETYLPAPLTEDEVRAIVAAAVEATGASGPSDMGKVMGKVIPQVKGRFDGAAVRPLVQEALK